MPVCSPAFVYNCGLVKCYEGGSSSGCSSTQSGCLKAMPPVCSWVSYQMLIWIVSCWRKCSVQHTILIAAQSCLSPVDLYLLPVASGLENWLIPVLWSFPWLVLKSYCSLCPSTLSHFCLQTYASAILNYVHFSGHQDVDDLFLLLILFPWLEMPFYTHLSGTRPLI